MSSYGDFGEKAPTLCYVCVQPVPEGSNARVGGVPACPGCAEQVARQDAESALGAKHFPTAVLGGAVGALVAAAIWAGICVATGFEVGYIAVGVGALTGLGVKLGARNGRSPALQLLAVALAVVSLVAAKFFTIAYIGSQELGVSMFSAELATAIVDNIGEFLVLHDFLWIGLAVFTAWKIPAPNSK